jgi:hypothetical protein
MQQYVDYGFIRTQNMIEDGERRARRHVYVGPLASPSQGAYRKVTRVLRMRWASVRQHLLRSVTSPAQSEQSAG